MLGAPLPLSLTAAVVWLMMVEWNAECKHRNKWINDVVVCTSRSLTRKHNHGNSAPSRKSSCYFYSFVLGHMRIARTLLKLGSRFPEHCGEVAWQAWNFTPWSSHLPCGIFGVSNFAILRNSNTLLHSLRMYRCRKHVIYHIFFDKKEFAKPAAP